MRATAMGGDAPEGGRSRRSLFIKENHIESVLAEYRIALGVTNGWAFKDSLRGGTTDRRRGLATDVARAPPVAGE